MATATTTTKTTSAADKLADIETKRAEDHAKVREKSQKAHAKASVQDRLLLAIADALLKHPDFGINGLSELHGELAEEVGITTTADGQIIQHPEVRAMERQANIDLAVSAAKAAGLVSEDHVPAPDPGDPKGPVHPTSDGAVPTVSVPAGAPASDLPQDKPMNPTAKK